MWKRGMTERLPSGMPITPYICDRCGEVFRFLDKPDGRCYRCGKTHDLFINNHGEIQTVWELVTVETDEEADNEQ